MGKKLSKKKQVLAVCERANLLLKKWPKADTWPHKAFKILTAWCNGKATDKEVKSSYINYDSMSLMAEAALAVCYAAVYCPDEDTRADTLADVLGLINRIIDEKKGGKK